MERAGVKGYMGFEWSIEADCLILMVARGVGGWITFMARNWISGEGSFVFLIIFWSSSESI